MATAREIDDNGFMTVRACPISSFGIFEYSAGQLGLPGDPNRIVNVFRPESAINDPEAIRSFQRVPLIDDHEMLSGFEGDESATAPEDYGIDGVLTGVGYSKPWMTGDLTLYTRRIKKALDSGKQELSLGYSCDFEVKDGTFEGTPFEAIQTNMRGNHIALVDRARVSGARVLDSKLVRDRMRHVNVSDSASGNNFSQTNPIEGKFFCFDGFSVNFKNEGEDMKQNGKRKKVADNAVEQLRALLPKLLPALQEFMSEEATEPAHQGGEGAASAGAEGAGAAGGEGGEADNLGAEGAGAASAEGGGEVPPADNGEGAGAAEGGEGGAGLSELISQAEALIAQLKAATSGGASDEGEGEGENAQDLAEGLASGGEHTIQADAGEGGDVPQNGGKAPAGPSAGVHSEAGDAALRRFYADSAVKGSLYDRVSKVVGTFDHARMDARQVAAYGLKHPKINVKAKDGAEIEVLTAYLTAHERGSKTRAEAVQRQAAAQDSAATQSTDAYAAYMNGKE